MSINATEFKRLKEELAGRKDQLASARGALKEVKRSLRELGFKSVASARDSLKGMREELADLERTYHQCLQEVSDACDKAESR